MHLAVRSTCRAKAPDRSPETRILLLYPGAPLLEVEVPEKVAVQARAMPVDDCCCGDCTYLYAMISLFSFLKYTVFFFLMGRSDNIARSHHVTFNSFASVKSESTELYGTLIVKYSLV